MKRISITATVLAVCLIFLLSVNTVQAETVRIEKSAEFKSFKECIEYVQEGWSNGYTFLTISEPFRLFKNSKDGFVCKAEITKYQDR